MKNRPLGEALERHTMSRRLDGSAPKYQDAIDPEEKSIRQAQTLAEQGFIGKACKAIGTNRVLDGSSKTVQDVLETKHPSGTFFMPDAPLQTMPFHGEAVQRAVRKLANGSAPCCRRHGGTPWNPGRRFGNCGRGLTAPPAPRYRLFSTATPTPTKKTACASTGCSCRASAETGPALPQTCPATA